MTPALTVVVPVFRNRDTVRALLARIGQALTASATSYEIVFVDDACPAGSLEVLKEIAQENPCVLVLALARNVGQHQAVLVGLGHARGDWVAIMDADLQDPPEALPALLEHARAGYDVVFAGRRGRYESPLRLLTSRLYKRVLHTMTGVPADAGLFCILSRRLVRLLLEMNDGRPSLVAMIGCAGVPACSLPITRLPRPSGRSAYGAGRRLATAWRGIAWALRWKMGSGKPRPPTAPPPALEVYGQRAPEHDERARA